MTTTLSIPEGPPQMSITMRGRDLIIESAIALAECPQNIGSWLRRNAERFPDKAFILQRNAGGAWNGPTYAEALTRVNRLSNGLLAQGLDEAHPLAILSENSVEMALLQLAAMQVGIPVVPISYAYSTLSRTGGHIKHILDLTAASLVVMSNADVHMAKLRQWDSSALKLYAAINSAGHTTVQPLGELEQGAGTLSEAGEARFAAVTAQTLAKIQFTSGSTNLPKGVEVTHGMQ
ncbi:MAG TPA: AMP-binding protein, partial [Roseiflexaceae bacterium]|nr:AMP-binding protein [Roseiflexaceae bacterium]